MMLRQFLLFGFVLTACVGVAQPDIAHDFVLTEKDAVGVLSPRVVCGSHTIRTLWSSDGSVLLAHRIDTGVEEEKMVAYLKGATPTTPPPPTFIRPRQELVFYSPRGNKVKAVVPLGDPENQISNLDWLPGSQQVVVQFSHQVTNSQDGQSVTMTDIVLVSSEGKITPLVVNIPQSQYYYVVTSPSRPMVALMSQPETVPQPGRDRTSRIEVYGSNGKRITELGITGKAFSTPVWGADSGLYLQLRNWDAQHKQLHTNYQRIDLNSGSLGPTIEKVSLYEEAPSKSDVVTKAIDVPMGRKDIPDHAHALAIVPTGKHDPDEIAIVSTDAVEGSISPSGEFLAYIDRGITIVRPLAHIPKEAFLAARAAARRMVIVSQAKQVGLAFIMYASDSDDNLPMQGANWQSLIDPYLKNSELYSGFSYSFKGGNMTDIESPAETELGRISGPGGNAIVFTDGHVKWIPDKPKA